MSKLAIHLASESDKLLLLECFKRCTFSLLQQGIDQWDNRYPGLKDIAKDIEHGHCFIFRNLHGIACITLNQLQDPQYSNINWRYNKGNIYVIHRLAVDPILAGQGIGKKLCQFAEKHARDLGGGIIRLDTYTKNPASNRLYESLAYELADGFCYFHGLKSPFNCYEKKLE